jgi:hypothetical protein
MGGREIATVGGRRERTPEKVKPLKRIGDGAGRREATKIDTDCERRKERERRTVRYAGGGNSCGVCSDGSNDFSRNSSGDFRYFKSNI